MSHYSEFVADGELATASSGMVFTQDHDWTLIVAYSKGGKVYIAEKFRDVPIQQVFPESGLLYPYTQDAYGNTYTFPRPEAGAWSRTLVFDHEAPTGGDPTGIVTSPPVIWVCRSGATHPSTGASACSSNILHVAWVVRYTSGANSGCYQVLHAIRDYDGSWSGSTLASLKAASPLTTTTGVWSRVQIIGLRRWDGSGFEFLFRGGNQTNPINQTFPGGKLQPNTTLYLSYWGRQTNPGGTTPVNIYLTKFGVGVEGNDWDTAQAWDTPMDMTQSVTINDDIREQYFLTKCSPGVEQGVWDNTAWSSYLMTPGPNASHWVAIHFSRKSVHTSGHYGCVLRKYFPYNGTISAEEVSNGAGPPVVASNLYVATEANVVNYYKNYWPGSDLAYENQIYMFRAPKGVFFDRMHIEGHLALTDANNWNRPREFCRSNLEGTDTAIHNGLEFVQVKRYVKASSGVSADDTWQVELATVHGTTVFPKTGAWYSNGDTGFYPQAFDFYRVYDMVTVASMRIPSYDGEHGNNPNGPVVSVPRAHAGRFFIVAISIINNAPAAPGLEWTDITDPQFSAMNCVNPATLRPPMFQDEYNNTPWSCRTYGQGASFVFETYTTDGVDNRIWLFHGTQAFKAKVIFPGEPKWFSLGITGSDTSTVNFSLEFLTPQGDVCDLWDPSLTSTPGIPGVFAGPSQLSSSGHTYFLFGVRNAADSTINTATITQSSSKLGTLTFALGNLGESYVTGSEKTYTSSVTFDVSGGATAYVWGRWTPPANQQYTPQPIDAWVKVEAVS